jgi:two-component system, OmpR family, sensor kinase
LAATVQRQRQAEKMFNSIRWTVQLWNAGILFLALAGFGTVLYVSSAQTTYTEIDNELAGAARVFVAAAKSGPAPAAKASSVQLAMAGPGGANPGVVSDASLPVMEMPQAPATAPAPAWLKNIPADCLDRLGWDESDRPYFVIRSADGAVIRKSAECPAGVDNPATVARVMDTVEKPTDSHPWAYPGTQSIAFRQHGDYREIMVSAPQGATIVVGRSIERERAALVNLRWSLLSGGGIVMIIGLLGGLALSQRVLRPIRVMSETARSISASDLSQRIDERAIKSELGSLARTLNGTFDRLESAFVQQAQFTADASHELRTPLAVIHAGSELALSRERSAAEYRAALETNLRASRRMNGLVASLLVLARADANGLELRYSRFDLRRAVDDCLALLAPLARQRNVAVECEGPAVSIEADRDRVLQLITNLVTNGIQYNRAGGSVKASIAREGIDAVLKVIDTGIGIARQDEPRIFQRFFRVDKARSRASGGCGLGLAICKSIAEAHGGTIAFATAPEVGTTFTIRLPLARMQSGAVEGTS